MELTLGVCLLIAFIAFLAGTERFSETIYICRPLIVCTLTGLACGDLHTGLIAGGLVELSFIGIVPVGGTAIPDAISVAIMTVVITVTQGIEVTAAFGLAFTVGYLMQYLLILQRMAYSIFVEKTKKIAASCNIKKMISYQLMGYAIIGLMYGIVIFICTYFGQDVIGVIVEHFPEPLTHGLSVAGGLLPAIGFGILLTIIFRKEYLPYLILGFVITCFIDFGNILPTALIGAALALLYYQGTKSRSAETGETYAGGGGDEGI
ncbi:MAG: PTS N-acetylgalactosamine transporter subunit IIC [Dorea sp.]|jgi:PTS system galactosamine-specific IIC component|nr:PTS N-acetylgalactosamine transporter subunit IIC [Dorea sp.]